MNSSFHIRTAALAAGDDKRLLKYFDTQLPWLATVGSGDQWGSEGRSHIESYQGKYRSKVERSEVNIAQGFKYASDWIRAYMIDAEVELKSLSDEVKQLADGSQKNGRVRIPVAAMILETEAPDYVRSVLPEQDPDAPFVYLSYLLSDRRTSSINKGAGAALIRHAKEEIQKLGIGRLCGDCWAGNDRKLVK